MVDIDEAVTTFCKAHLEANTAAFEDPRLELINDDARAQLEDYPGTFDVIIGDLADPVEGGPCYQVSKALHFVTVQKGPQNFLSNTYGIQSLLTFAVKKASFNRCLLLNINF